jgi:hypothetical protein
MTTATTARTEAQAMKTARETMSKRVWAKLGSRNTASAIYKATCSDTATEIGGDAIPDAAESFGNFVVWVSGKRLYAAVEATPARRTEDGDVVWARWDITRSIRSVG